VNAQPTKNIFEVKNLLREQKNNERYLSAHIFFGKYSRVERTVEADGSGRRP